MATRQIVFVYTRYLLAFSTPAELELSENLTIPRFSTSKAYGWYLRRKMYRERKIQGKTNRRMSIFNPMLKLVVVNLYTKFEVSILNGCGDICDETSGEKEKGTNARKNK